MESESEVVGKARSPILGGYDDPGTGSDGVAHDDENVVGIFEDLGGGNFAICSGSLLAPNMVLTAHHCVADIMPMGGVSCASSSFGPTFSPSVFHVTTLTPMPFNPFSSSYASVSEVQLASTETAICGNDVAILILSSSLATTPLVPRVDVPNMPNDIFNAVGYGGTTDTGNDAGTRRRRDGLVITCLESACPAQDQVSVREWQGNEGTCEGDSGGPALDTVGRAIGVTSRGLPGCLQPTYGYIYGYADWLKSMAQHAAMVGGYTPPAWSTGFPTDPAYTAPIGASCTSAATCPGGLCVNGFCSRPCNDVATCGDGYTCNASDQCVKDSTSGSGGSGSGGSDTGGGCGCVVGADPTKPVPWFFGAGAVFAFAALRRRRSR
jgi:MYXO-CTERM domain-containing protein